jgi:hypothetical protein
MLLLDPVLQERGRRQIFRTTPKTEQEMLGAIIGDIVGSVYEFRNHRSKLCEPFFPQALVCALTATSFEDAIRNAISIGGDSDTVAAIAGGVAIEARGRLRQMTRSRNEVPNEIHRVGVDQLLSLPGEWRSHGQHGARGCLERSGLVAVHRLACWCGDSGWKDGNHHCQEQDGKGDRGRAGAS